MTESPWVEVGEITVTPEDAVVDVGALELAQGADTLWIRMTNLGLPEPWPWSYGILSFRSDEGQSLGSTKAFNSYSGEVFRLGVGLPPLLRTGMLTFEPRGFNLAWVRKGNPWTLGFEAQSGSTNPVPSGVVTAINTAKAWANFAGTGAIGPQSIRASFNVLNINKTGTGRYTVTFQNPPGGKDLAFTATANQFIVLIDTITTSGVSFSVTDLSGNRVDATVICFTVLYN
jgi:hypothetical protein